jgi:hypothetical protein
MTSSSPVDVSSSPTTTDPAVGSTLERWVPVAVRVAWVLLAVAGLLFGRALDGRSTAVMITGQLLWWLAWGVGLVAVLVWHPIGLVWLRCAAPIAVVATTWAARSSDISSVWRTLSMLIAVGTLALVLSSETGHACVNGAAYPNERRFLLRPAAALAVGPLVVFGLVAGAGVVVGPMLLAARQWIVGGIALLVGWGLAWVLGKALYAQARRFVVFVPAGFVLHDEFVVRDPVLFGRRFVQELRPADADSDSLDLTNGASGLVLEALLTEKIEIVRVMNRKSSEIGSTARFLFVPTLPGRLLTEARTRHLAR